MTMIGMSPTPPATRCPLSLSLRSTTRRVDEVKDIRDIAMTMKPHPGTLVPHCQASQVPSKT
jgi:hypothetical protein